MVSIPMSAVHFYVNEKKRTVTAWADVELFNEFLRENAKMRKPFDNGRDEVVNWILDMPFPDNMNYNYHAVGVARCAPEDEFDAEKGKQLALTRMMDNVYGEWLKLWFTMLDRFDKASKVFKEYIQMTVIKVMKDMERREDLVKDMM